MKKKIAAVLPLLLLVIIVFCVVVMRKPEKKENPETDIPLEETLLQLQKDLETLASTHRPIGSAGKIKRFNI